MSRSNGWNIIAASKPSKHAGFDHLDLAAAALFRGRPEERRPRRPRDRRPTPRRGTHRPRSRRSGCGRRRDRSRGARRTRRGSRPRGPLAIAALGAKRRLHARHAVLDLEPARSEELGDPRRRLVLLEAELRVLVDVVRAAWRGQRARRRRRRRWPFLALWKATWGPSRVHARRDRGKSAINHRMQALRRAPRARPGLPRMHWRPACRDQPAASGPSGPVPPELPGPPASAAAPDASLAPVLGALLDGGSPHFTASASRARAPRWARTSRSPRSRRPPSTRARRATRSTPRSPRSAASRRS